MNIQYRKELNNLAVYTPGKPIEETERELGIKVIAKLASNENPLGCSDKVKQAISKAIETVNFYPDASSYYLKEKISEHFKLPTEQIVTGPGSEAIINLIGLAYLSENDEVIMSQYAFIKYLITAQLMGSKPVCADTCNYVDSFQGMVDAITPNTKVIFLANPNNPLGSYVNKEEIYKSMDKIPQNILVVFDEAYTEYLTVEDFPDSLSLLKKYPNLIVLKTFSKIYGLAGLRVGYGFAQPEIINRLNQVKNVFDIPTLSQIAATKALDDQEFVKKSCQLNQTEYKFLTTQLKDKNIFYIPSQTNFITIDTKKDCVQVYQELLKQGIIIRPMKGYKLDTFIRVSIGTREQNELFLKSFYETI